MDDEKIGKLILDSAFKIHTALGPGLLESCYEACLEHELLKQVDVKRQVILPVHYDGTIINAGYRLDLLVGGRVIVELKAVEKITELHLAQLLSYLKLGNYRLGYLLNFNVKQFRQGIKRVVNGL